MKKIGKHIAAHGKEHGYGTEVGVITFSFPVKGMLVLESFFNHFIQHEIPVPDASVVSSADWVKASKAMKNAMTTALLKTLKWSKTITINSKTVITNDTYLGLEAYGFVRPLPASVEEGKIQLKKLQRFYYDALGAQPLSEASDNMAKNKDKGGRFMVVKLGDAINKLEGYLKSRVAVNSSFRAPSYPVPALQWPIFV
jgi:hypothetical protein